MSPLTSTVSEFKDSKGVLVSRHNIDLRQSSGEATCTQTGSGTGRDQSTQSSKTPVFQLSSANDTSPNAF
jgi:hypothetical protein